MEKNELTLSFNSEKMTALSIYLKKENTTVQKKMEEALRQLYETAVPEPVREYLDIRSAPVHPRRPVRPSHPKAAAPDPAPAPVNQEKEGSV